MELRSDVIVGTTLSEIQKKSDGVKLVFEDAKSKKAYVLTFEGLLFESSAPTLNKRVGNIQLNDTLGFRAISQLRHMKQDPENYRQLFIQMEGSDDQNKLELIAALRHYKITPRYQTAAKVRTVTRKKPGARA